MFMLLLYLFLLMLLKSLEGHLQVLYCLNFPSSQYLYHFSRNCFTSILLFPFYTWNVQCASFSLSKIVLTNAVVNSQVEQSNWILQMLGTVIQTF